jgi:hypothetical protein
VLTCKPASYKNYQKTKTNNLTSSEFFQWYYS